MLQVTRRGFAGASRDKLGPDCVLQRLQQRTDVRIHPCEVCELVDKAVNEGCKRGMRLSGINFRQQNQFFFPLRNFPGNVLLTELIGT